MAKRDKQASKLSLRDASDEAGLKHNPFGQLGTVGKVEVASVAAAPSQTAAAAPSQTVVAEREAPPAAKNESRSATPASRGRVVLRREKKHRGGKAVVVIAGLRSQARLQQREIDALAQALKRELGCGGAVEAAASDTEIVIQGDQAARVAQALRARGFRVDGVTS